jgi:predicted esterase
MSDEPPAITEHHLTITRTARYYTLGDPAAAPSDIWIVCHGFGQLARSFIDLFRAIARPGRLVIAPEALNRYYLNREGGRAGANARVGGTWMTREDRLAETEDYVRYLDVLLREIAGGEISPRVRVTALGFSQGAAVVARWLVHGEAHLDRVILWCGLLPPEIDPAGDARSRLVEADLHFVCGREDTMIDAGQLRAQTELLSRADIPHRVVEFSGGHELNRATLLSLAG